MKRTKKVKETFPHFRLYKKSKHPALIVGEQSNNKVEEWNYRKVTHSEKDGRHLNEKVYPNPNLSDNRPMYISKRVRHDIKKNFSSWKYPWKYKKKRSRILSTSVSDPRMLKCLTIVLFQ